MSRLIQSSVLLLSILWLLPGCPDDAADDDDVSSDDDDDATGDDDDVTADDDDVTADDDDATADDDDNGDDDDMAWPDELYDGTVMLMYSAAAGVEVVQFYAVFWDIEGAVDLGSVVELPDGPDECGVFVGDVDDITVEGDMEPMSAGLLTLAGPGDSWDVAPQGGQAPYYTQMFMASELEFEASYDLAATGAQFPAFDETGSLYLPASTQLITPDPSQPLHVGSQLEVTWSGPGTGDVLIQLTAETLTDEIGLVYCLAENDGAFTVPASAISQLPGESEIMLTFMDVVTDRRMVDGYEIAFWAGSTYVLMTQNIPG